MMAEAQGKNLGVWWGWADGASGWGTTTNGSLQLLDTIVQLGVIDNTLTVPPSSPAEGDRYIVGKSPAPTGAWANHGDDVAAFLGGAWAFYTPKLGWTAFSGSTGRVEWNGTAWQAAQGGIPDAPSDGVGYARKDGGWTPVATGSGIPEAPADGKQYARKNSGWAEVQIPASSMATLSDANISNPQDQQVVSWDAASGKWINKTISGGGGIPDAPNNANQYTRGQATWNVLGAFVASGASHAGGLVPDPGATAGATKYLREDAQWAVPPYPSTMVGSGASHAAGLVPDPGATAGTTKYLREDGTWVVPPAGGSTTLVGLTDVAVASQSDKQVIAWNAASAKWTNQTVTAGIADAPSDGTKYMRQNGTWASFFTKTNPYGAHKYWRINCSAAQTGGVGMRVAELRFIDTNGAQIATTGGTASGSAQNTTFGPDNAFDGNTATYYRSNSAPLAGAEIFLGYQWPAAKSVARVQIAVTDNLSGGPSNFTVQYSDDGSAWTTAWTVTGAGPYTDQVFIDFASPDVTTTSDDQLRWLGDVKLTSLTDGQAITWSASQGKFVNASVVGEAPTDGQRYTRGGSGTATWQTLGAFVKSGSTHAAGLVPDPGATAGTTKYLREDATWATTPLPPVMGASGGSHAAGLVPDPGIVAGTTRFLREDATWATTPLPPVMGASGGSHAAGLVPDPGIVAGTTRFLREDATWATTPLPPVMGASGGSHAAGLVPDPGIVAGTTRFLREDGTWATTPGATALASGLSDVSVPVSAVVGPADTTSYNNGAYNWNGNLLTVTQNCVVTSLTTHLQTAGMVGVQLQAAVAPASSGTLTGAPTFSSPVTIATAGSLDFTFNFPTPVALTAGTQYAFLVGCPGQAGNYATPIDSPGSGTWPSNSFSTMGTRARVNVSPPVNGSAYDTQGGSTVPVTMRIGFAVSSASGQYLRNNGANWTNSTIQPGDLPATTGRNRFVDGNVDSWQIGTSFNLAAATDQYTADMWRAISGTGGATTVSRITATPESAPKWIDSSRRYKLRFNQTTAASSAPQLYQNIEGVNTFSGRSVTVSTTLVAAAAANLVTAIQVVQNFGSGGSPASSVVTLKNVTWSVGTTESRFSVRVDIPSIAGKQLGTNGDDKLQVAFVLATGITFTLDFSQLQIEESDPASSSDVNGLGGAPSPFEYRGLALETARVKRYIERLDGSGGNIKYYAYNISGNYGLMTIVWSSEKARSPTTSIGGTWVGTSGVVNTPFVDAANKFVARIAAQWSTTGSGSFDSGSNGYVLGDARP
ncbi:tail fiber protein [Burkholderia phage BcepNazgul]|uniref:Tail fiber protein n=1 Tax=Burkholderia phage BcepNazgul TaxID=242861 RepID=Q6UYJ9_9CAUD|nr:tail fiber protein [Burkholderia phage BcepNazgul]AAQ63342.1 tail fiber protein [Burkholderia phage BcepNazgul]